MKRWPLFDVIFPNSSNQCQSDISQYSDIRIYAIYLSLYFGIKSWVNTSLIPLNSILNSALISGIRTQTLKSRVKVFFGIAILKKL